METGERGMRRIAEGGLVGRMATAGMLWAWVAGWSGVVGGQEAAQGPQTQAPSALGSGQQPAAQKSDTKIAVEVKTVSVLATVRDKHGKIVANLTKDDFQ